MLNNSTIVCYSFKKNLKQINNFVEKKQKIELLNKNKVIPVLGNCDLLSNYNEKNTARHIGARKGIAYIPYNSFFMESASEGNVAEYFLSIKFTKSNYNKNDKFLKGVDDACNRILAKVKELQLGKN